MVSAFTVSRDAIGQLRYPGTVHRALISEVRSGCKGQMHLGTVVLSPQGMVAAGEVVL